MSAHEQVAYAQLDTQAFALMSRLHVVLRRECGRITDIEYMRIDPTYCRHILELAERMPNETLPAICLRLQEVFFGPDGLFNQKPASPLLANKAETARTAPAAAPTLQISASAAQTPDPNDPPVSGQAYVGRLR